MPNHKRIYLVSKVDPEDFSEPFACSNFKMARQLIKEKGQIQVFNLEYKTSLNRIRKNGYVALYDKTRCLSDEEAQVMGYWSVEEIDLCISL